VNRRDVDELLRAIAEALERGDRDRAARLLGGEGRVLLDGFERTAAGLGYTRYLLERGDPAGAHDVIRAVPTRGPR
jgi:hypothetical protein